MLKGVFFDLDETLIDADGCHREASRRAFAAFGMDWDEAFRRTGPFFGRRMREILTTVTTCARSTPVAQASMIACSVVPSWEARIPILKSVQLPFCPSDGPSWRRRARARRLTWLGRPHVEEKPRMLAPASLAGVSPAIFLRRTRLLDAREAEAGVEDSVQVLRQRPVEAGYGEFGASAEASVNRQRSTQGAGLK